MALRKNFYIYLVKKMEAIKEQIPDKDTPKGRKLRDRLSLILEKIGIAAITTLLVYYTMVYLNLGRFLWPDSFMLKEMGVAFIYLLALFWAHRKISFFVAKSLSQLQYVLRSLVEVVVVILVTIVLSFLLNHLPLTFIFPAEVFRPERLRAAYVVSIILSLFFYYFVERERSKKLLREEMLRSARLQKESFEAQLQSLKSQVNPHFLFNSLNVLGSLIQLNQDKAVEFVRKLSDVYRSFLDNSQKEVITLKEELEIVESYNYLLKTRFGEAIDFETSIDPQTLHLTLPPGALQTLVENAVKHNGSTRKDPLLVRIYTEKEVLNVANKLKPKKMEKESTGVGLQNIINRYKYLTDKKPSFEKTETEFLAQLPLLKIEPDESSNH